MTPTKMLIVAACAAVLAVPGMAVAADQAGEHQERVIALNNVPAAAVEGASTVLTSIAAAEEVRTKDGRTIYEFKGRNDLGKTVELYVTADGQVLGTEPPDE